MIVLVDSFNVIYKFSDLEDCMYKGDLVKARNGFFQLMLEFRKNWKKPMELHLFFDGKKKPGDDIEYENVSGMYVYYSHDKSADFMIKEFIKKTQSPGLLRVVSSDKDIFYYAKKKKCAVQTSEEFSKWVLSVIRMQDEKLPGKDTEPDLSDNEVNYWLNMFRSKKK